MKISKSMSGRMAASAKSVFTIGLLCPLLACGGGSGNAATPEASAPPAPVVKLAAGTWVVIGSSSAEGAGAPQGKGWVALLQGAYSSHGALIANLAKGGTVTYHGLSTSAPLVANRPPPDPERNIDQALSRKPVLLLVAYPSNDTSRGYSVDETVNNLLAIRNRALAANVPVVMLSTQPRNLSTQQLAQMRAIDERLAAKAGACLADVRRPLAGTDGRLAATYSFGDGVHPNEAVHQIIATQIQTLINSQKCVSTSAP